LNSGGGGGGGGRLRRRRRRRRKRRAAAAARCDSDISQPAEHARPSSTLRSSSSRRFHHRYYPNLRATKFNPRRHAIPRVRACRYVLCLITYTGWVEKVICCTVIDISMARQ